MLGPIEKFDLAQSFWHVIHTTFGYQEDTPSLRNLLIRLLVTDYAGHLHGDVPQSLAHLLLPRSGHANAVVCLAQWRDSHRRGVVTTCCRRRWRVSSRLRSTLRSWRSSSFST